MDFESISLTTRTQCHAICATKLIIGVVREVLYAKPVSGNEPNSRERKSHKLLPAPCGMQHTKPTGFEPMRAEPH